MPLKQTFVTALTDVWTNAADKADKAGDVRWEGNKCYKCVQYDSGAGAIAAIVGRMAAYYLDAGYQNNQVTLDTSDGREIGAGLLMSAPLDGQFCWVQIKGLATITVALVAGAAGDPLTLTGATADNGSLDLTAAVTDHVCAYAVVPATPTIILDCPF